MSNTPQIRFSGFTDAWEQRKLEEVTGSIKNGYSYKADGSREHTYKITRIESISTGVINTDKLGSSDEINENYRLQDGDILFSHINSLQYIANTALYTSNLGEIYHGMNLLNIRAKSGLINSHFLFHLLKIESNRDWFRTVAKPAVNQASISTTEVGAFEFLLPNLKEQQVIADYFDNLDHLITLHQRKCDALQKFKKSMLQKMFPQNGESVPEIRFAGFTDAWEQRELRDFGKATGGTSIESEFSENGKYKVISIGSYSEDSIYRDQGIRAIESEKTKIRVLNKGDLTMILNDKTSSGNIIGRVLLIEESGVYVYNQRTERIEVDHDNYDSLFIYEMLNAQQIRDKIVKQSQGNTQIYVNWSTITETGYLVPQIDEQRCLGEFFSNLDTLITLHQRKLETLQKMKKSLLQKMFV